MANSEYAEVIGEGGQAAIEFLAARHSDKSNDEDDGEELCDACSSALLSEALQHSGIGGPKSNVKRMVAINLQDSETKKSSSTIEDEKEMAKLKEKLGKYRTCLLVEKLSLYREIVAVRKRCIFCSLKISAHSHSSLLWKGVVLAIP